MPSPFRPPQVSALVLNSPSVNLFLTFDSIPNIIPNPDHDSTTILDAIDALKETCQHLASLNDRIKQVLTTAHIQDLDWTRTNESFTRLEDVARFLSQIATVRINEMHHRAERGTSLLEATELRQARLRNEMASGWIGAPVSVRQSGEQLSLVHFPSIQTVMSTWHHTTKWRKGAERQDVSDAPSYLVEVGDGGHKERVVWARGVLLGLGASEGGGSKGMQRWVFEAWKGLTETGCFVHLG
ncbi:hypothetical protein CEP52_016479 [Fusarium oligoseptatum]|uniref:Uncharacterized protein n=1 Tax=Fusarium oligoseptatum TaxID=2604345 RepID=A0A428S3Q7_9HYPO|nr:hypothetical protein CEP52_016479 [Fusarium oligoseptatum]